MPPTPMPCNQIQVDRSSREPCPAGATLSPGNQEMAVLLRIDKPPLRFKGRRLTRHWQRLSHDMTLSVELWRQLNKGFVLSYSVLNQNKIGQKAIQISNVEEATDCLENVCANLAVPFTNTADISKIWTELQLHLCFKQRFTVLVGCVLADWHQCPQVQEQV